MLQRIRNFFRPRLAAGLGALSRAARLLRARYEVANNSYAKGIVLTLANDLIGTGPRLQMLTDDPVANGRIERAFQRWARAVRLAEKLRTMRMACVEDGEWKARPEQPDNHWLDCLVGCAVAGSIQGVTLPGTTGVVHAKPSGRIKLSEVRRGRRA